jgi:hypothetical protein
MRDRIWTEIQQSKQNHFYCIYLVAHKRRWLDTFTIITVIFSGAGLMGLPVWSYAPVAACIIVTIINLLKLLQPHIVPSEKQILKLDQIVDFYFDYCNKLEKLWQDSEHERINDVDVQEVFYTIKDTEKPINTSINEIVKRRNKKITKEAQDNTTRYLKSIYNLQ